MDQNSNDTAKDMVDENVSVHSFNFRNDNAWLTQSRFIDRTAHYNLVQNFRLIWFDINIDESSDDFLDSISKLRCIVNTINIFNNIDECVDFLTDVIDEKVFMIVSSTLDQRIVALIHDLPQLDVIYIFCEKISDYESLTKEWRKVEGAYTQIISICESLKQAARRCDQNLTSTSITLLDDLSNQNLDQLDQSFMYTMLLKEILLEMEYNQQSVKDLSTYYREQYINNRNMLNIIDQFEQRYSSDSTIWWYTSENFIYSMLNRALRTQEIDKIIKMGFFIRDLHRHIEQLHREQFDVHQPRSFSVYRGQGMSDIEFERMRKNQGNLLSFNNFLSTSIDRDVSYAFADSNSSNPDLVGILFEINIDSSIALTPFANLDSISRFRASEKEILFSMHTIFRIDEIIKIDKENDRLWNVKLSLTSDKDEQLHALTERLRVETRGSTGLVRLGHLMIRLSVFDKAEHIYRTLLNSISDDQEKANFYHQLGGIKLAQCDYEKAFSFYAESLEIYHKILPANHPDIAASCDSLGLVCTIKGDYSNALLFHEHALRTYQAMLSPNHSDLSIAYNNIGNLYNQMGDLPKALSSYEKAVVIKEHSLPANHPSIATSYNNMGMMFSKLNIYSKAMLFVEKALRMRQKSLPANHPDLANSYNNIGWLYEKMGKYLEAATFYKKSLEIHHTATFPNLSELINSCNNISRIYLMIGEYSQAFMLNQKVLEIKQKIYPPNHLSYANSYDSMGAVYSNTGKYADAVLYYEKALHIREKALPFGHSDFAISYGNMGSVYDKLGRYSEALSFHERALEILQKASPSNHSDLAMLHNKIGSVYNNMGEYSKAILFYERAVGIAETSLPPDHLYLQVFKRNLESVRKKL